MTSDLRTFAACSGGAQSLRVAYVSVQREGGIQTRAACMYRVWRVQTCAYETRIQSLHRAFSASLLVELVEVHGVLAAWRRGAVPANVCEETRRAAPARR